MSKPATKSTKKSAKTSTKRFTKASKTLKASQKIKGIKPTTNKPAQPKPLKAPKVPSKPKFTSQYPRSDSNPFREGSAYGIAFDIMAAHPEGMPRQALVEALAKATGKSEKLAGYDAAVLLSARPDSRHQSCRPGFTVVRENDNVRLEVTAPKPTEH